MNTAATPTAGVSSADGGTTTERQQPKKAAKKPAAPAPTAEEQAEGLRIIEREEDEVSLDEDDPTLPDQEVRYERPIHAF